MSLALGAQLAHATAIEVFVLKNSILIASDSKQSGPYARVINKTIIMNDTVAVANSGEGVDTEVGNWNGQPFFRFSVETLLNEVKGSLPREASIPIVEAVIEDKMKAALNGLTPEMGQFIVKNKKTSERDHVTFFVVGYENGVPVVDSIYFEFDWNFSKVSDPRFYSYNPSPQGPKEFNFALHDAIDALKTNTDPIYRVAQTDYPRSLDITVKNMRRATLKAADLIRLEGKYHPDKVGPPINTVIIRRNGAPVTGSLPE
jgi:hypothetical protein